MEASSFAARPHRCRFGINSTSQRAHCTLEDSVKHRGLKAFSAGVRSCNLGVLESESESKPEGLQAITSDAGRKPVEDSADVLTLGYAGITIMKTAVDRAVGDDVQIIDSVLAGVQHLAGLCHIGAKPAKKCIYASAADEMEQRAALAVSLRQYG